MPTWDAALDGYAHGPAAATEATGRALDRVPEPRVMILVEGVSDQIAIDTLAGRRGRDLVAEQVAVVPIGGAQAAVRFAGEHSGVPLVALCDEAELGWVTRAVPPGRVAVCRPDLEAELIAAVGVAAVLDVLAAGGDLRGFLTLTRQPAWAGRPAPDQLRRFIAAGSRRKLRYARALVAAAVTAGRVPAPLDDVLGWAARAG